MNQRWRLRIGSYRPAEEQIKPREYEAADISEAAARAFVLTHHYLGSFPSARFRHGLYRRGRLVGVAVFAYPTNTLTLTNVFPVDPLEAVVLSRFVLLDEVPGNGETWFLARCFELLRAEGQRGVVSFADPLPRQDATGHEVTPGHVGTIYKAHNGVYLGRSKAEGKWLLPDGTTFHREMITKIRYQRRGWRSGVRKLVAHGAAAPGEDLREWLAAELARIARRIRHPGNHKYAWALDRRLRRHMPEGRSYPRKTA